MKRNAFIFMLLTVFSSINAVAQDKWYNPQEAGFPVVQGQAFSDAHRGGFYHRMPSEVEKSLRPVVWSLSRQSAGLSICFTTDAREIRVKYVVKGNKAMAHMPATGVSGIDLYTHNRNGEEIWLAGRYSFGDTITYEFSPLSIENEKGEHRYNLFLPLYNEVEWMQIGTNADANFRFEPLNIEKPILAYGTSICQGACASRPGMAWTNILQRRMGRNIINWGFSGSAFLESEVIELMSKVDAKAYIIDAMPNAYMLNAEILKDTIMKAVHKLRAARPETPILLVDHLGYPHGKAIENRRRDEQHAHNVLREVYGLLSADGVCDLHYLSARDIAMPQDATVEGIHASDYGMWVYANAYEKKLRTILHEKKGDSRSTIPAIQQRDSYNWMQRHHTILSSVQGKHYDRVIIGNSIIHFWGGVEGAPVQRGCDSWNKMTGGTLNLGCGWDRTENVLWRIQHDELDNITADRIYLKIGTNNIGSGDSDGDVLDGISAIVEAIKQRRPEAQLTLMGILPRRGMEERIRMLNNSIAQLAQMYSVEYLNPGVELLGKDGKIIETLFTDGLHPNSSGYEIIARYIK